MGAPKNEAALSRCRKGDPNALSLGSHSLSGLQCPLHGPSLCFLSKAFQGFHGLPKTLASSLHFQILQRRPPVVVETSSNPVVLVRQEGEELPKDTATIHRNMGDSEHRTLHKKEHLVDLDNLPEKRKEAHVVREGQMDDKDVVPQVKTQVVEQRVPFHGDSASSSSGQTR